MSKASKALVGLAVIITLGIPSAWLIQYPVERAAQEASSEEDKRESDAGPIASHEDTSRIHGLANDTGEELTFEQIKREAERGSAEAQRKLSEIYSMCAGYSLDPAKQLATLDQLAALTPASKNGMDGVKKRLIARCKNIDSGQPIPTEAVTLWAEQAAKGGDIAAKIRMRTWATDPLLAEETDGLLGDVLSSGDPDALLEMSSLMSRPIDGALPDRYQGAVGDATAGAAWGVAACRAGANCRNGSMLMDSICISTGKCNYPTYEQFLISEVVTPSERARMELIAGRILRMRTH